MNMTRQFINTELNRTLRDRADKLKGLLHLLLSLAAALTTALIPLVSLRTLLPNSRNTLLFAAIALFVSLCSGMAGLIFLTIADQNKLDKLYEMSQKSDADLEKIRCIMGGNIWPTYIASGICGICFVVAILLLSLTVRYLLFS
jgi:hypothetical protein